jgi:predicted RNA-binding protein YlqC (UPF0109 family)
MPKRSSKRPRDVNQLASLLVDEATRETPGSPEDVAVVALETDHGVRMKNQAAVELGRLGGKKGGTARAARLTKEERSAIARKGAAARWQKK